MRVYFDFKICTYTQSSGSNSTRVSLTSESRVLVTSEGATVYGTVELFQVNTENNSISDKIELVKKSNNFREQKFSGRVTLKYLHQIQYQIRTLASCAHTNIFQTTCKPNEHYYFTISCSKYGRLL